ncbi:MAG TPA: hypothetical protein VGZ04_11705 [Acidimicrobiales bacterium]|jgi:hypothetical protein|nr:hypothetical protein [Acidimicrobiales bacterium]
MARDSTVTRRGQIVRSTQWHGVRDGDKVVVNAPKELRHSWTFVAHVVNEATGEEWVEVRGGRTGESKGRSFRCELIFPGGAKKGSRVVGLSLATAPQLALGAPASRRSR